MDGGTPSGRVDYEAAERLADQYGRGLTARDVLDGVGGMEEGEAKRMVEWSLRTHSPGAALVAWARKNGRESAGRDFSSTPETAWLAAATAACRAAHEECAAVVEMVAARRESLRSGPDAYRERVQERAEVARARTADYRRWRAERREGANGGSPGRHREAPLDDARRGRERWHAGRPALADKRERLDVEGNLFYTGVGGHDDEREFEREVSGLGGPDSPRLTEYQRERIETYELALRSYLEEREVHVRYLERRMVDRGASYSDVHAVRRSRRYRPDGEQPEPFGAATAEGARA